MEISSNKENISERAQEVKAFDDSKAGVKGLVDAGVVKVPKIFIRPPDELSQEVTSSKTNLQAPVIDLTGIEGSSRHEEIIREVRIASGKWGFFQVVNHGIPLGVLEGMIDGIRAFHEQDPELKKVFYSRDAMRQVSYVSNYDLYRSRAANWRDTLSISLLVSDHVDRDEIPSACRAIAVEYIKNVTKLGETLFELFSEALGLKTDHLTTLDCGRGRRLGCHYYPACPEPDLTLGASKHTDPAFLTILLQDQLGGLQVMHDNQWVDVQPIADGLVINIGDLLQIISNNKFKSVNHRVLANRVGPRISVAAFFTGAFVPPKLYGPIKELISEENPPLYRDFTVSDYIGKFLSNALDMSGLDQFKL